MVRHAVECLCRFFGVHNRTVHGWKADGVDIWDAAAVVAYVRERKSKTDGVINRLADPECENKLRAELEQSKPTDEDLSIKDKKTSKEIELLELKIQQARGELVNRGEMREVGQKVGALFIAELNSLTNDVPGQLAGADEATIRERLESRFVVMVNRIREALAQIETVGIEK
jgi:hypothetical protein